VSGRTLRLATRGSPLARWQAQHVAARLTAGGDVEVELVAVSTEGDRRRDVSLSELGGKGVFVKEVQAAVLDGRADLAVHSAKDLPALTVEGLVVGAVPERADPRDALAGAALSALPAGATVATGSKRRSVQLLDARPDLHIVDLRGNIDTRLAKVGEVDAVVVAVAALERLDRTDAIAEALGVDVMLPQVGQGALAVECRSDDDATRARLSAIEDAPSRVRFDAERAFLAELGGDCDLPAGAFATLGAGGSIRLRAMLAGDEGIRRVDRTGVVPEALGREAAISLASGVRDGTNGV
jgi:hydroxymethylbilane synthase